MCKEFHAEFGRQNITLLKMEKDSCKNVQHDLKLAMKKVG